MPYLIQLIGKALSFIHLSTACLAQEFWAEMVVTKFILIYLNWKKTKSDFLWKKVSLILLKTSSTSKLNSEYFPYIWWAN